MDTGSRGMPRHEASGTRVLAHAIVVDPSLWDLIDPTGYRNVGWIKHRGSTIEM